MKTRVTILLEIISSVALPSLTLGATWNALEDFSLSQSATSTWQYGYGTAGLTFSRLTHASTDVLSNGKTIESWYTPDQNPWNIPLVYRVFSDSAFPWVTGVLSPDALMTHPGETSDFIVQWTAPSAGSYSFSGLFRLQDAYTNGVIGEVYANSTQLYAGTLTVPGANHEPGQSETFSGTVALNAGDKLFFAVNDNGSYGFDTTGFNVTISNGAIPNAVPELPVWAMLIVGFAGLALANRRSIRPAQPHVQRGVLVDRKRGA